jgi:hypothetical protein
MIARLIIGDAGPGEIFVSGDAHPEDVRVLVRALHANRNRTLAVATWSPAAIGETIAIWDAGEESYERIFLRGSDGDAALSSTHDPRWLNHFAVGDLLLRGELDPWLDPRNNPIDLRVGRT